jgi:hypothetical protein
MGYNLEKKNIVFYNFEPNSVAMTTKHKPQKHEFLQMFFPG